MKASSREQLRTVSHIITAASAMFIFLFELEHRGQHNHLAIAILAGVLTIAHLFAFVTSEERIQDLRDQGQ